MQKPSFQHIPQARVFPRSKNKKQQLQLSKSSKCLAVEFELKLNTHSKSKDQDSFEILLYITGFLKLSEKLRLEKLRKLDVPKIYDSNLNVKMEGELQLYNQSIRGQMSNSKKEALREISPLEVHINAVHEHEVNYFFLDNFEFLNVVTQSAINHKKSAISNQQRLDQHYILQDQQDNHI